MRRPRAALAGFGGTHVAQRRDVTTKSQKHMYQLAETN